MQIKTTVRYQLRPVKMAIIKKSHDNKCWQRCGERGVLGTSLVVQWLRLHALNAGGLGSIPGQGTRSCMLQLRSRMLQLKILHATTKDPACHN